MPFAKNIAFKKKRSMKSILLHIIAFAAGALVCYLVVSDKKPSPEYLFLVNATATKEADPQGDATRILTLDVSEVMTFTDRPYHRANPIEPKDLLAILKMNEDEKNPPNASLVVFHPEKKDDVVDSAIVEIVHVELSGKSVFTMEVKRVDDGAKMRFESNKQAPLPDVTLGTRVSLTINNFKLMQKTESLEDKSLQGKMMSGQVIDRSGRALR